MSDANQTVLEWQRSDGFHAPVAGVYLVCMPSTNGGRHVGAAEMEQGSEIALPEKWPLLAGPIQVLEPDLALALGPVWKVKREGEYLDQYRMEVSDGRRFLNVTCANQAECMVAITAAASALDKE